MFRLSILCLLLLLLTGCSAKKGEVCKATAQCAKGLSCCGTCVELEKDLANCGGCGQVCGTQNAGAICQAGACRLACQAGFADCNATAVDGCEANLAVSAATCGDCSLSCNYSNAAGVCQASRCSLGACAAGFSDCDRQGGNGCEVDTRSSAQHCGGCGLGCTVLHATARCLDAGCGVGSCDVGWGDCDSTNAGCETDLNASSRHCGACGQGCDGGLSCVTGECKAQELVLFGGFVDSMGGTASAGVWRFDVAAKTFGRISTDGGVTPRGYHAAAWDRDANRMLVFGGTDGTTTAANDVLALDFSTTPPEWKVVATTGTPPGARLGMSAGWDPSSRTWYLFGGLDDMSSQTALGDLWIFSAATGTWSAGPAGPGARFLGGGAWDSEAQRFVVSAGGSNPSTTLDDAWAFDPDAGAWQDLSATPRPGSRFAHVMFSGSPTVLFGGVADVSSMPTFFDDTWSLTTSPPAWRAEAAAGPPSRAMPAGATLGGVDYLFGGFAYDAMYNSVDYDDVWAWSPSARTWTELRASGAAGAPGVSQGSSLVARE